MNKDNKLTYIVVAADVLFLLALNFLLFRFFENGDADAYIPRIGLKFTTLIMAISYAITVIMRPPVSQKRTNSSEDVVKNVLVTGIIFGVVASIITSLFYPRLNFPRTYIFTFIIIYTILLLIERIIIRKWFKSIRAKQHNQSNVVLIGNSIGVRNLFHYLSNPFYGYKIRAYFNDEPSGDPKLDALHSGTLDDIYTWLSSHQNINEIYAFIDPNEQEKINMLAKYCDNNLIRFFYVPNLHIFRGNLSFSQYGSTPIVARRREPLTYPANKFIKRTFDIIFSIIVLLTVFPIVLVISAILIKLQSPGPIFFRQARTGLDGKSFYCLKFRSMHVNKDSDKIQATFDDPRKFAYGNFMRKMNIDELPQFVNVLLGDMSVVGPRPHMLKHTAEYSSIINRYMVRHLAKPGITGLAQVSGFRGETKHLSQMEDRIKKDIEYIENWTLLLDIRIIIKTITNVFTGDEMAY